MDGDGYKRPRCPWHDAGTEGHSPRGAIRDTDSRGTIGPDPVAEDIRIVTQVTRAHGVAVGPWLIAVESFVQHPPTHLVGAKGLDHNTRLVLSC